MVDNTSALEIKSNKQKILRFFFQVTKYFVSWICMMPFLKNTSDSVEHPVSYDDFTGNRSPVFMQWISNRAPHPNCLCQLGGNGANKCRLIIIMNVFYSVEWQKLWLLLQNRCFLNVNETKREKRISVRFSFRIFVATLIKNRLNFLND